MCNVPLAHIIIHKSFSLKNKNKHKVLKLSKKFNDLEKSCFSNEFQYLSIIFYIHFKLSIKFRHIKLEN